MMQCMSIYIFDEANMVFETWAITLSDIYNICILYVHVCHLIVMLTLLINCIKKE